MTDHNMQCFTYFGFILGDEGPEVELFSSLGEARNAVVELRQDLIDDGHLTDPLPDVEILKIVTKPITHGGLKEILNKSGRDFAQTKEVLEVVTQPQWLGPA